MKNIILAIFLSLSSLSFATVTLVQSNAGGSATGSIVQGGTLTTNAVAFSNSTVAGNLLVCLAYSTGVGAGVASLPVINGTYGSSFGSSGASTPVEAEWKNSSTGALGFVQISWIGNAPSMNNSTNTITVTTINDGTGTQTLAVEFDLYEFSGVLNPLSIQFAQINVCSVGCTSGTPTVSFGGSTTNTDLILVAQVSQPGANIAAGSGYILGINATVAVIGQLQYQLNAPAGQTSASFSGSEPKWEATVVTFEAIPSGATVVPRHQGFVN